MIRLDRHLATTAVSAESVIAAAVSIKGAPAVSLGKDATIYYLTQDHREQFGVNFTESSGAQNDGIARSCRMSSVVLVISTAKEALAIFDNDPKYEDWEQLYEKLVGIDDEIIAAKSALRKLLA